MCCYIKQVVGNYDEANVLVTTYQKQFRAIIILALYIHAKSDYNVQSLGF